MKIKFAFLGILTALSLFAVEYKLSPASGIKIDGKLDEQSWQAANTISNFVLLKNSGKTTPSEKTEVKMLTDQDALYFGFKCYGLEDLSDDLKGEVTNAWANDLVEIFIAPTAGKDEYYQFALTAGGAYWSQFFAEAGNIKPDPYKPGFQLATGRTSDAWILEVRFPYSAFYMTSAAKTARNWAINVARYSRPKKSHATTENSSWANLQGSFHETKKFNMVTGIPPKPAKFDMLIPTVTFGTQGRNDKGFNGILDVEISLASAPAGKYIFDPEKPHRIRCLVNGEVRQDDDVTNMLFSCAEIVKYCSSFFRLEPDDLIFTGTPAGVILGQPKGSRVWLKPGDVVRVEIEGIGSLTNQLI